MRGRIRSGDWLIRPTLEVVEPHHGAQCVALRCQYLIGLQDDLAADVADLVTDLIEAPVHFGKAPIHLAAQLADLAVQPFNMEVGGLEMLGQVVDRISDTVDPRLCKVDQTWF